MALKDAEQRIKQNSVCRFAEFLSGLDKDDKATVASWISAKKPAGWMARVIIADGHKVVSDKSVKRHIDGICVCPDGTEYKGAYVAS